MQKPFPKIADVVVMDKDKVLLVQQRKQIAYGLWSYPGGHVEENETLEEAVIREVKEELGVELVKPKLFKIYSIVTSQGPLKIHTFTGNLKGQISLKNDELIAYKWFSIPMLEASEDSLRSDVVLQQAKDMLSSIII